MKKTHIESNSCGCDTCHIEEPLRKRVVDAGAIAVILFILYFFAQELNLLPGIGGGELTLLTVFMLGLVASTSTCMATSGALFLATVGKLHRDGVSFTQNIIPAISFNLGRITTYTFFGFLTGYVGKVVSTELQSGSFLTVFVAIAMVLVGLDMLKIIRISSLLGTSFTKRIFEKIERKLITSPKRTSFFLGAATYFLPCGFTQTVQIYALGIADPIQSALIMGMFALGTVPALMAIGFVSSFTKSALFPLFSKVMGTLVVVIGLSYFSNFLALQGINLSPVDALMGVVYTPAIQENGYQVATMVTDAKGYHPNNFSLKQNVPVKWVIKGENVFGCQGYLMSPLLGVKQLLKGGENVIEFTPEKKGVITFSCGMGMFRGQFNVM